ncbi:MAG: preprotein translocase subunit YajC [Planctomycetia bacterium]|jgi:preprotein translocase subunit YajC|nr:preprotein translocase subunit YajC [Planctomycetia bacterium]NCF97971.1 preprotein translocase subunit YajC [Planctomycetia bacterium]NCG13181.1 preprotein translocase subunit YajC [Planctomycetia bacterium]NCG56775.1 preprotein translocase subunit YajC [Pseudomonadota bacterium]
MAFSIATMEFTGVQNLLHTDLISLATAAGGTESSPPTFVTFIPLMVIIWAVMYFMVIRPQKKQTSEHENMIASLEKHKEVRTVGGIIGKVALVDKDQGHVVLVIDESKSVRMKVSLQSIAAVTESTSSTTKEEEATT